MSSNDTRAGILGIIRRVNAATVRELAAPDPDIYLTGDTAVAVCPRSMTYLLNGTTYSESGHDVLVFNRHDAEWRAVWRAPLPAAT